MRKVLFFSPLRFEAKNDFGHETSKLKPHSIRASEPYQNHKNPILVRETVWFFDLVESFESDFSSQDEDQVIQWTVGDFPAVSDKIRFFKAKLIWFFGQFFFNDMQNNRNKGLVFSITKACCLLGNVRSFFCDQLANFGH